MTVLWRVAFLTSALAACAREPLGVVDVPNNFGGGPLVPYDPSAPIPAPSAPIAAPTPPSGPISGVPYLCDTGTRLGIDLRGDRAVIAFEDGRSVTMPRIPDLPPDTYAADGYVWFQRGDRGLLTDQGGQQNCRVASSVEDQASGVDPFTPIN